MKIVTILAIIAAVVALFFGVDAYAQGPDISGQPATSSSSSSMNHIGPAATIDPQGFTVRQTAPTVTGLTSQEAPTLKTAPIGSAPSAFASPPHDLRCPPPTPKVMAPRQFEKKNQDCP